MEANVTKPASPAVTLTMSVEEFRLLDAVQYHFLGGGTLACFAINNAFREARTALGVEQLPKRTTDSGFGVYFDAQQAQVAEEGGSED